MVKTKKDMNEPPESDTSQTSCSSRDLQTHMGKTRRLTSASKEIDRTELLSCEPSLAILTVIGDPNIRKDLSEVIGEIGVMITAVSDLCEARKILEHERPHLVICSAHLNDGTFRDLFSLAPGVFTGMVVLCSGSCSARARIDALELGIMDYVSYPLPLEELRWVIHSAMSRILEGQTTSTTMA